MIIGFPSRFIKLNTQSECGVQHNDPYHKTFHLNNKSKLLYMPPQYIYLTITIHHNITDMK